MQLSLVSVKMMTADYAFETKNTLCNSPLSINKNSVLSKRHHLEALCNKFFYSKEPRDDAFCLGLNFNISKVVYFSGNLYRNAMARQVARNVDQCNTPCNGQERCEISYN